MHRPSDSNSSDRRFRRLSRTRDSRIWRRVPFALLIVSLVLAGVGAWEAQRTIRDHQVALDGVLTDYAGFAAWTFAGHAEAEFPHWTEATFRPVTRALRSGAVLPHPERLLAEVGPDPGEDCSCYPSLAGTFGFRIPLTEEGGGIQTSGSLLDAVAHEEALRGIQNAALAAAQAGRMKGIVPVEIDGAWHLVAVLTVGCPEGDGFEAVYGVNVDPDRLRRVFREIHGRRDLLPPTLTGDQGNDAILRLAVLEPGGEVLFGDPSPVNETGTARASLGFSYGDLEVEAAVVPEAASQLVIGGLPRSRTPWMFGLFGLAIICAVVAVGQLRRENELALLRSDFVAGVSHELRTPLAQIRLFLETLRLGRFHTEREREWSMDTIDRETRRLTHLVENVLHFSRAEKGITPATTDRLDIAVELRDAEEAFRPLASSRKVQIRVDAEEGLTVDMHRDSFRQAVLNLMDNAVKYGPPGQTIRLLAGATKGRIWLAVEDEGPGIPEDERGRIWEPFQRGSRAGSQASGSGIGLAVVREIVARSAGAVRVEDAPSGGARFVIELPGGQGVTGRARSWAQEASTWRNGNGTHARFARSSDSGALR